MFPLLNVETVWNKPEHWFRDDIVSELSRHNVWLKRLCGPTLKRHNWRLYFRSDQPDDVTKQAIGWFAQEQYQATDILFFKDRASGELYVEFTRGDYNVEK